MFRDTQVESVWILDPEVRQPPSLRLDVLALNHLPALLFDPFPFLVEVVDLDDNLCPYRRPPPVVHLGVGKVWGRWRLLVLRPSCVGTNKDAVSLQIDVVAFMLKYCEAENVGVECDRAFNVVGNISMRRNAGMVLDLQ